MDQTRAYFQACEEHSPQVVSMFFLCENNVVSRKVDSKQAKPEVLVLPLDLPPRVSHWQVGAGAWLGLSLFWLCGTLVRAFACFLSRQS